MSPLIYVIKVWQKCNLTTGRKAGLWLKVFIRKVKAPYFHQFVVKWKQMKSYCCQTIPILSICLSTYKRWMDVRKKLLMTFKLWSSQINLCNGSNARSISPLALVCHVHDSWCCPVSLDVGGRLHWRSRWMVKVNCC